MGGLGCALGVEVHIIHRLLPGAFLVTLVSSLP
jgi:hypothetical protein